MNARTAIGPAALLIVSACAAADEEPSVGTSREALRAEATAVETELAFHGALLLDPRSSVTPGGMAVLPQMIDVLVRGWGVEPNAACTRVRAGDDGDRDGVPEHTTIFFDCRYYEAAGAFVELVGNVALDDRDDGAARDGWVARFDAVRATRSERARGYRSLVLHGEVLFHVRGRPPSLRYGADMTDVLEWHFFEGLEPNRTETLYESSTTAVYVPRGQDFRTFGELRLDGTAHWYRDGTSWTPQFSTISRLVFEPSCKLSDPSVPGFVRGGLSYQDAAGTTVSLIFSGCDEWKYLE